MTQRQVFAIYDALATVLLGGMLCALFALFSGCPRLPAPSGCTPRSYRCVADHPEVCSASQRWTRIGDLPCADVGAVCVVLDGLARCQPVDGGAP